MKNNYRGWGIVFLCVLAAFLPARLSSAEMSRTILRVGYVDIPAYLSMDENGSYRGYAYEYMENLADYGGWRMEYVPGTRAECLQRLLAGEVDVIPGSFPSIRQQQLFDFTRTPFSYADLLLNLRGGQESLVQGKRLRIGYFANNFGDIADSLQRMARAEQITYEGVSYSTYAGLMEDYENQRLDGYVMDSIFNQNAVASVGNLARSAMYLTVKKGNDKLLHQLDTAAESMELVNPRLKSQLFDKYFMRGVPLLLTSEERAYLQQKKKITAFSSSDEKPYTYFENGIHKGIIEEIIRRMSGDLGIEIEIREISDNAEMLQALENGEVDIITDFYSDYNWAHAHNVDLTFPYLDLNYVAVMRRTDNLPEKPRVACVASQYYTKEFVERKYPAEQLVYYDTMRQCMEAVSQGKADMTFTKAVTAQQDIWSGSFYNLMTNGNVVFSHKVSIGVNDQLDPMLLHILNKEICHLDPAMLQGLTNEVVFNMKEEQNVISLIYRYPLRFVTGILLLALLAVGTLLYILYIRRQHMQYISKLAYTNPGSGIYNMYWFEKRIPEILPGLLKERRDGRLFIIVFGISRLDILKETYGHRALLEALYRKVRERERENPWIQAAAAFSGIGKVFCLACLPENRQADELLQEFVAKNETLCIGNMEIHIQFKAGACRLPTTAEFSLQHIIGAAETAYNELQGTIEKVGFFDEKLQQERKMQKQIEDHMVKALKNEEFQVWYQPKYDLRTKKISGAEALVRWQSPVLGFLMPGRFITIFERNGFIMDFDYYMLEHVCQAQSHRMATGKAMLPVSVNQSGLHMNEEGYIEKMQAIAAKYALPAGAVELELTETAFVDLKGKEQSEKALYIVSSLQKMGFAVSMDDFGSGYSSLVMLKMLPIDVMKIDRSLLTASEDSPRAQCILHNIIQMGKNLRMMVICEGIETVEQEKLLLMNGCCYGQGFLYARPMPGENFRKLLDEGECL